MEIKNKQYYYSNFKRSNKWLGILDYKLIIFLIIYFFILIKILTFIRINIEMAFSIFCTMSVPAAALVIIGCKEENSIEAIVFLIKYLFNRKFFTAQGIKKFRGEIYK